MSVEAHAISFAYPGGPPVLDQVSARFEPGAVTALVGPNGAGKSTLLRLLAGLERPQAGRVTLAGSPVGAMPERERARSIAYLAQRPSLAFDFTVERVVRFGAFAAGTHGTGEGRDAARAHLERVGLGQRAADLFCHLSVGQQQLASLARALVQLDSATDHPALLADEPMSAMDPAHALRTGEILRELASRGVAVVLVVHDLTQALGIADRALVLSRRGTVHAQGDARAVLTPETLAPAFGVGFCRLTDAHRIALVPAREPDPGDPI